MIRLLTLFVALLTSSIFAGEMEVVQYATTQNGTRLELDLFQPEAEALRPAIVLVHGGGWTSGSRKGFHSFARELQKRGYVVANISYRLAGEAKFPAAVQDVAASVRWMKAHAEKYRIDTGKIYLVGGSAGGHLSALVATTGSSEKYNDGKNWADQSSEVAGFVIMGSGVDQVTRVKETKNGRVENCVIFLGAEFSENPEIYAEASPITHVTKKTPPVLMIEGENDRPGKRYVDWSPKLDSLGVRNELVVIPKAKHGQWGKEPFLTPFVEGIDQFLKTL